MCQDVASRGTGRPLSVRANLGGAEGSGRIVPAAVGHFKNRFVRREEMELLGQKNGLADLPGSSPQRRNLIDAHSTVGQFRKPWTETTFLGLYFFQ